MIDRKSTSANHEVRTHELLRNSVVRNLGSVCRADRSTLCLTESIAVPVQNYLSGYAPAMTNHG